MEYLAEPSAQQWARIAGQLKDLPISLPYLPGPGLETSQPCPVVYMQTWVPKLVWQ